jgi:NitT/TauT family transport system ATP-binding protein
VKLEVPHAQQAADALVRLEGVSLTYQGTEAFDGTLAVQGTDLAIGRGEFVAIVGPSGCGKSSLLKLISGLMLPSEGSVRVANEPVVGPLKIVGMAFQNPTLLPWRTTLENVLLPLEIVEYHRLRFKQNHERYVADAKELLGTVGLTGFEDRYPWQLSGGMQQRVSLCRSLIHQPDLLLLDEPFAALDAFTREELWEVLQELWLKKRFTVVLVTHDLREALYLSDTVYVMSARPGRIIAQRSADFPRPRSLEGTYTERFVSSLAEIRSHISKARAEAQK